jgi:DNA-binding response OmpR family regulator
VAVPVRPDSQLSTSRVLAAGVQEDLISWLRQELENVSITTTGDVEGTLREFAADSPSLLLLDRALAGSGTVEVLRRFRDSVEAINIPVIYLLEREDGATLAENGISDLNVDRVVFHPVDKAELARHARYSV